MPDQVIIIGGGLAGLSAARLIRRAGLPFQLFEARDRLGGRILSADHSGAPAIDGFDLGPSWFWPAMQPELAGLIAELGLPVIAQHSEGDIVVERMSREPPRRYVAGSQGQQSMRLAGGTATLVAALAAELPQASLHLGTHATRIALDGDAVVVSVMSGGTARDVRGAITLLAAPPRLMEASIAFSPALDPTTARRWRDMPTWMAPHAKFFALYDRPFWREAGLSGTAQSMVGPLVEIHDATTASGQAALFGFVGVGAAQRKSAGEAAIVAAALRQLERLFGPQAATPRATLFKDWAADPLTAAAADATGGDHPVAHGAPWTGGAWRDRLVLGGSETSSTEPGYLAGAVEAATRAAAEIVRLLGKREEAEGAPSRVEARVEP